MNLTDHEIKTIQTMVRRANASLAFKTVPGVVDDITYSAVNPQSGYFKYSKDYLQQLANDPAALNNYLEAVGKTNRIMYNRDLYEKLLSGKELDKGDLWTAYNNARENGFEYDSDQIRSVQLAMENMDDADRQLFLAEIIGSIESYGSGKQDAAETYEQIQGLL